MTPITDCIYIGNHLDAQDKQALTANQVKSIVCLDGSRSGVDPVVHGVNEIEIFTLIDGSGNRSDVFQQVVEAVTDLAECSPRLLVHCHAGRSRSVVAVAAYLMRIKNLSAHAALDYVTGKRDAVITPDLGNLLLKV